MHVTLAHSEPFMEIDFANISLVVNKDVAKKYQMQTASLLTCIRRLSFSIFPSLDVSSLDERES